MEYYVVYVNYPTSTATVHKSTAKHARKPGVHTNNGMWHGTFDSKKSACKYAKSTGVGRVRCCRWCFPTKCSKARDMSSFSVQIEIAGPDRRHWVGMDALVDTGAFISSVPASVLRSLGVAPAGKRRVRFGQGDVREMDYAQTWLRFGNQEIMTFVMFNAEGTTPLLGAFALEGLFMAVDPVDQRLIPLEEILT